MEREKLEQRIQQFPGAFECHISVSIDAAEFDDFKTLCETLESKALFIELSQGSNRQQPMLCRRLYGETVLSELQRLYDAVDTRYSVQRLKLEAALGNEGIPQTDEVAQQYPGDCYFEHHLKLQLNEDTCLSELSESLKPFYGHLSRNAFSRQGHEHYRFVTQRFYQQGNAAAKAELNRLLAFLEQQGITCCQSIREYNIYDSYQQLDAGWMNNA